MKLERQPERRARPTDAVTDARPHYSSVRIKDLEPGGQNRFFINHKTDEIKGTIQSSIVISNHTRPDETTPHCQNDIRIKL